MKKIAALILICLLAQGQTYLPLTGAGSIPTSAAPYAGPGDVVSGASIWYGLRGYTAAAATAHNAVVNLTRASDSHTCDINLASTGGLGLTANCSNGGDNGTAVATWCNATTCTADELYDQGSGVACTAGSGNVPCPILQATGADQPTLAFSCAGSLPCLSASGSQFLTNAGVTFAPSLSQPYTIVSEAERTGRTSAFNQMCCQFNVGGNYFNNSPNQVILFEGSISGSLAANDNVIHSVIGIMNGTSSIGVIDGSATMGLTVGNNTLSAAPSVMADSGSQNLAGNWFEGGAWAIGFNSTQYGNMATNMASYY